MGFNKFANAAVVKPFINMEGWDQIRHHGVDFTGRTATKIVLQEYDPKQFMLTHCTIVASVDTEAGGLPTGRQMYEGRQIDRRYPDFLITPGTSKYINNNNDAWERKLLLSSFRTFIGGDNFVEHLQIPELSKGKIVDAAARDIGDSIYIDILVATNKKHGPLIAAIQSGQLSTLSMGCSVQATTCSKCGNVAEDEIQLCNHIRYFKGGEFFDAFGKKRKIAELCGHIDDEPGSVKFIEASWVANPAFPGAVLRNIISPSDLTADMRNRIQVAFSEPTRVVDPNVLQKAARSQRVQSISPLEFDELARAQALEASVVGHVSDHQRLVEGGLENLITRVARVVLAQQQQDEFPMKDSKPKAPEKDPLDKPSEELYNKLVDKVVDRLKKNIDKDDKSNEPIDENRNETLIRSAMRDPKWRARYVHLTKTAGSPTLAKKLFEGLVIHTHGGWGAVKASKKFSGKDFLALAMLIDRMTKKSSIAGISRIYRTVMAVGGTAPYENVDAYLAACRRVVGRDITQVEKTELVLKGKLFSLAS